MSSQQLSYPDVARIAGTGLISTGVGLLFFVLVTIAWGDPFTMLNERGEQQQLQREFRAMFGEDSQALQASPADARLTRADARRARRSLRGGQVAGRLSIRRIGLAKYIVKDAGVEDLKRGPGIYGETAFPGSGRPVAIAGHRTTHGAPFLNLDKLRPGDAIVVDMSYARFTYRIKRPYWCTRRGGADTLIGLAGCKITPRDWSIIGVGRWAPQRALERAMRSGRCPRNNCEHLVLTACHPKYSAQARIAVFATLETVSLRKGRRR